MAQAQAAFAEAEEVIGQLIQSYASKDDVDTVRDVHRLVEDTVNMARQREAKAQEAIKGECARCPAQTEALQLVDSLPVDDDRAGLSSKSTELEVEASYSDAKQAHQARLTRLNKEISGSKATIQHLNEDLRYVPCAARNKGTEAARAACLDADRPPCVADRHPHAPPPPLLRWPLHRTGRPAGHAEGAGAAPGAAQGPACAAAAGG